MFGIRRREFMTLLGGAAAWPVVARAQQADRVRRIGWLDLFPEDDLGAQARNIAFRQSMEKLGWIVGRNLVIDYRWGVFDVARARAAAAELLNLAPDVIMSGGTPGALALQQATRTVPIVFAIVSEPVTQGIVASLAHPGGNLNLIEAAAPKFNVQTITAQVRGRDEIEQAITMLGREQDGGLIRFPRTPSFTRTAN